MTVEILLFSDWAVGKKPEERKIVVEPGNLS